MATLFETVFSAPIDKRKEDWLILLASTVDEVCGKVENLTPENFLSTMLLYLRICKLQILQFARTKKKKSKR
ncbi:hypothetical protein [Photobacterium leiognathi]|uniref:hypothetical protein n=1 Tax=Photobacterium leiognathi TaxID=553611 RepID=UPI0027395454|nr:hypothetical protein [Photobacterium leiognathi]